MALQQRLVRGARLRGAQLHGARVRDGNNHGSTGQTELDSRSYEINDYQHLACQVLGAVGKFNPVTGPKLAINPSRVVTTGGPTAAASPGWH